MKEIVEGKNPVTKGELVPIQEIIDLTIEGIPQEVIDELYDMFETVDYSNFKKLVNKSPKVYAANHAKEIENGEYKFQDEYWKIQQVKGTLLERCNVVGFVNDDGTFYLTGAYSYNTIKEGKR